MQTTLVQPNGLHISTRATMQQLVNDKTVLTFANGLLLKPLLNLQATHAASQNLGQLLCHPDAQFNGLITALLVLDTEVNAVVNDKTRSFPLPGFLSYCSRLPLDRFSLNTLRLPPLNPDGHYSFLAADKAHYLAVRMDIHPALKVVGHIRVAIANSTRSPVRLQAMEHRLDRQVLKPALIEAALAIQREEILPLLTNTEQLMLTQVMRQISA